MWGVAELGGGLQVLKYRLWDVGQQLMEVWQNLLGLLMMLLLLMLVVMDVILLLLLLDDGSDIW